MLQNRMIKMAPAYYRTLVAVRDSCLTQRTASLLPGKGVPPVLRPWRFHLVWVSQRFRRAVKPGSPAGMDACRRDGRQFAPALRLKKQKVLTFCRQLRSMLAIVGLA